MKRLLIALGVTTALIGAAQAGDLYRKGSTKDAPTSVLPEPVASAPSRPWEGPYIGVGLGYRWSSWKDAATQLECLYKNPKTSAHSAGDPVQGWDGKPLDCKPYSTKPEDAVVVVGGDSSVKENDNGFIALGRVGYDWQRQVVFGVFGEVNYVDASTHAFADSHLIYAIGARVGLPVNDHLMPYINGGFEITDYSGVVDTKVDPFVGLGLDVMLQDGWTITPELRWTFRDDSNLPVGWSNDDPLAVRLIASKKF